VAERAQHFYQLAHQTLPAADRRAMVAAELMGSVYWRLLQKLQARAFNVFGDKPIRLNKGEKLRLVLRTWFRFAVGAVTPNYGKNAGTKVQNPLSRKDSIQRATAKPAFPVDENQRS
jgi:hypothetical protein